MRRRRGLCLAGALTARAALGYSGSSLLLERTLQTHTYDLVIFDAAVRSYAHFKPVTTLIKGWHNLGRGDSSELGAWREAGDQDNAYLIIMVFAAVDGLARLDTRILPKVRSRWQPAISNRPQMSRYHRSLRQEDAVSAANHVPSNVVIEAAGNIAPELTSRDIALLWDGGGDSPRYSDPVVICTSEREFTFSAFTGQTARVRLLRDQGTVYSAGGYLVMHKPRIKG